MGGHQQHYTHGPPFGGRAGRIMEVDVQRRVLELRLGGMMMDDGQLEEYCRWISSHLNNVRTEFRLDVMDAIIATVDVSSNKITDAGVKRLTDMFDKWRIHARVLKLFKNRITDAGAKMLAEYVWMNPSPICEVHLSHNQLTEDGMKIIMDTFRKHDAYPGYMQLNDKFDIVGRRQALKDGSANGARRWIPVWLRLENNQPRDVFSVLDWMDRNGVTYCLVGQERLCNAYKCHKSGNTRQQDIKIHLAKALFPDLESRGRTRGPRYTPSRIQQPAYVPKPAPAPSASASPSSSPSTAHTPTAQRSPPAAMAMATRDSTSCNTPEPEWHHIVMEETDKDDTHEEQGEGAKDNTNTHKKEARDSGESGETTEEVMAAQEEGHDGHGDEDDGAGDFGVHDDTEISNNDDTTAAAVDDNGTE
ncbi:unnamed protein product [Vitrella brassicaformis CCMP3155]|uniref:Uncharacterized protein n=1 Tax=Vitrella brassicaformis (strain CCMP3155) TaxID=1169540 RepID=A0A0G4GU91_VITBC|nr:unnamed protein product [Vitrella brassicaformis CCMP3155]|eukprot:CEM34271.1 unnamed protein product [Vitrella brassicaformis CCMP3155]